MFLLFLLSPLLQSSLNHPPTLTVNSNSEPILLKYGESVELPIHVADLDGDPLTLYYKFDDDPQWHPAPTGSPLNVLPGYLFSHLRPDSDHTLHVLASDGALDSQPHSFGLRSWFKRIGPRVKKPAVRIVKIVKRASPGALNVAKQVLVPPAPAETPPPADDAEPQGIGIPMTIESVRGSSVGVSYSIDGSPAWSRTASYPLGEFEVIVAASDVAAHAGPGEHRITFRYEEPGDMVTQDEWRYEVNSRPDIEVSNLQPLSFRGAPSAPVSLPLQVHDADGDEISLWYRFDGQGDWTYVPAGLGENVLPAEAFAGRGSGFVEIAAWDGYEHSDGRVRISYAFEAGDADGVQDDAFFGGLSPAAFAGIVVGAVAVIALAAALILVATRRKAKSSSTGLIESE